MNSSHEPNLTSLLRVPCETFPLVLAVLKSEREGVISAREGWGSFLNGKRISDTSLSPQQKPHKKQRRRRSLMPGVGLSVEDTRSLQLTCS